MENKTCANCQNKFCLGSMCPMWHLKNEVSATLEIDSDKMFAREVNSIINSLLTDLEASKNISCGFKDYMKMELISIQVELQKMGFYEDLLEMFPNDVKLSDFAKYMNEPTADDNSTSDDK